MTRSLSILLIAATAGCAASTDAPRDAWDYVGTDPSLQLPNSRANGRSPEVFQQQSQEEFFAWRRRFEIARDAARDACARATGQSGEPSFWTGYDTAFVNCMQARQWKSVHGGNPL